MTDFTTVIPPIPESNIPIGAVSDGFMGGFESILTKDTKNCAN
jgi:hypothetical protein